MYHSHCHTKMIIFNIFTQLNHISHSFGRTVGTPLNAQYVQGGQGGQGVGEGGHLSQNRPHICRS